MSIFDHVSLAPSDPIFGLLHAYRKDPRPFKITFVIGFYKNEHLVTPVLSAVKAAEKLVYDKQDNKEYLPIDGDSEFTCAIGRLIFGSALWDELSDRIYGAQTIGGTGALRILGDFFKQQITNKIWISDPTWPNHEGIFKRIGFEIEKYPYFSRELLTLEFDKMKECFNKIPEKSLVLLHASCHNPTGIDLTLSQWKEIIEIFKRRQLIAFFDCAYQGFGKGVEEDTLPICLFAKAGLEIAIAYSCAKNFSLYGERVAALYILSKSSKNIENIQSQIKALIRSSYSNPPKHGAAIVKEVLFSTNLRRQWEEELSSMRKRMEKMRSLFVSSMEKKFPDKDFSFLTNSLGLFSYTGLNKKQVDHLISQYAVYMPYDGRINVTGLNEKNLDYVINSIGSTMEH